jgi:hypothetical protein
VTSALPHETGHRAERNRSVSRQPDQPLRLLLLRDKAGELPWMVQTIMTVMAPVEVVPVRSLANALWRLGRERFDTVVLDVAPDDRAVIDACRRHIADVAAIPVLDLNNDEDVQVLHPQTAQAPARSTGPDPRPQRRPWQSEQRSGSRPPRADSDSGGRGEGGLWPPRAGKRRVSKGRPAHLGGALFGGE